MASSSTNIRLFDCCREELRVVREKLEKLDQNDSEYKTKKTNLEEKEKNLEVKLDGYEVRLNQLLNAEPERVNPAVASAASIQDNGVIYSPSALSKNEIDNTGFDVDIPHVFLSRDVFRNVQMNQDDLKNSVFSFSPEGVHHYNIGQHICGVLKNEHNGTSESGLHTRDDNIFSIIRNIGKLYIERDKISMSTVENKRVDAHLAPVGYPPIVLAEEKANEGLLGKAIEELEKKFDPSSIHYHPSLEWIVGIAIAGDRIVIGKLHISNTKGKMTKLVEFDLSETRDRLRCAHVAINIGRWCLWVSNNKSSLLESTPVSFYTPHTRSRCILTLSPSLVSKVYKEKMTYLETFYKDIACAADGVGTSGKIPYLEWAVRPPSFDKEGRLCLSLKPCGVSRFPKTIEEIRIALRCVLRSLSALHDSGWAHLDLRWENIVWLGPERWFVIDAEFARPLNAKMPSPPLRIQDRRVSTADAAADLYLVGQMMVEIMTRNIMFGELTSAHSLRSQLLGEDSEDIQARKLRTASGALDHEFFH